MDIKTIATQWFTPAQMTDATGVSIETLRYYERENLIQTVHNALAAGIAVITRKMCCGCKCCVA